MVSPLSPPLRLFAGFGLGLIARDRLSLSAMGNFVLATGGWLDSAGVGTLVGAGVVGMALEPFFCQDGPVLSLIAFVCC